MPIYDLGTPPYLTKKFDNLMQKFLKSTRYKGVVVNSSIAIATIPSKYLKVFTNTMEMKRIANVPKSGIYDKRPITVIFSITLEGKFLPMH